MLYVNSVRRQILQVLCLTELDFRLLLYCPLGEILFHSIVHLWAARQQTVTDIQHTQQKQHADKMHTKYVNSVEQE